MCHHTAGVVLCVGVVLVWAGTAAAAAQEPFTAKEQEAFNDMYKARIGKATTRAKRAALAKELFAGVGGVQGGLKYLLLDNVRQLAADGGDLDLAIKALSELIAMKRSDPAGPLGELLDLQVRRFAELQRLVRTARNRTAIVKTLYALGAEAIDSAIALANLHRAARRFKEAEKPENRVLRIAGLISSPRRTRLRQGIAMSRALDRLMRQADYCRRQGKLTQAVWAYLDAGMYAEAAELKPPEPDATAALVLRAAVDKTVSPADILAAAKAWDKRSGMERGAMEQLRLSRAAELYRRYLAVGDRLGLQVAKVRLKAITGKLGDLLSAQRKSDEWVYLVDVQEVSARVGWGSFGRITAAKGPIGIAGRKFLTGLSVHAGSHVVYSLKGQYKVLSVHYGLKTGAGGAATFHVICDGKDVFKSGHMYSNSTGGVTKPLLIRIVGVNKLELVTKGVRGGAGAFSCWGDPKVR